jgi:hypothetical protein
LKPQTTTRISSYQGIAEPDLNVTFILENTASGPAGSLVASVIWENVGAKGKAEKSMHRMTALIAPGGASWGIFLLQFTLIQRE